MYIVQFDPTSNAADWIDGWQVLGPDGVPEDIYDLGWEVTIRLARLPRGAGVSDYYGCLSSPQLTGSTSDGTITVNDQDALEWTFRAERMRGLTAGSYAVGVIATKDGQTVQILLGNLPVIQGL